MGGNIHHRCLGQSYQPLPGERQNQLRATQHDGGKQQPACWLQLRSCRKLICSPKSARNRIRFRRRNTVDCCRNFLSNSGDGSRLDRELHPELMDSSYVPAFLFSLRLISRISVRARSFAASRFVREWRRFPVPAAASTSSDAERVAHSAHPVPKHQFRGYYNGNHRWVCDSDGDRGTIADWDHGDNCISTCGSRARRSDDPLADGCDDCCGQLHSDVQRGGEWRNRVGESRRDPANHRPGFQFRAGRCLRNWVPFGGSGQIQFSTNSDAIPSADYEIQLSVSGLPSGTTASVSPATILLGQSTTVTVSASSTAPESQNVTVTLTGTPLAPAPPSSITFLVDVTPPPGSLPNNRTDYVSTEDTPYAAVYDSAHGLIFASNSSWNRVDVISATTHATVGRRSAMCAGESGSNWSFDQMGRPLIESRINSSSKEYKFNVSYAYNLDGSLKTLTYPSGDVVTYTVGGAGRATQVSDSNSYVSYSKTTANPVEYAPNGSLASMTNGYTSSPSFAGIVTSNIYNDRLQPILLSASVGSSAIFSLCYDFHLGVAISCPTGTINAYSTGDNGNVFQVLNEVDPTRTAAYIYDPLNRIAQAYTVTTSGQNCWGETYATTATAPGVLPAPSTSGIDAWSNLTNRSEVSGMAGNCLTELFSQTANSQNHLSGLSYDIAGNVLNDGYGNTPTYDAENRIVTDAGVTYYYDADGVRMEKSSGTMYWPSISGEYLTETNITGTIDEEYIYFNGSRIARVDRPSGEVHYYFSNHLGSHTMVTSATGACEQDIEYFPYGGVITDHCPNVAQHYKFTGKERDTESGNDYFGARYYGSSMGRMMSPDPDTGTLLHIMNPQRWNMYAYALNNPLTITDPTGRDAAAVNFSGMVAGLGHEGIVSINPDGSAEYARFGPAEQTASGGWGLDEPGQVQTSTALPTVQFGVNGLPTDASMAALKDGLAKIENVSPSTVRINYFKTTPLETANLNAWIKQQQANRGKYKLCSSNCANFTARGLVAGGALTQSQANKLSIDPNRMFQQLTLNCHTEQTTTTVYDSNGNTIGSSNGASKTVCSF
jgi:RHS repeat-associated protein